MALQGLCSESNENREDSQYISMPRSLALQPLQVTLMPNASRVLEGSFGLEGYMRRSVWPGWCMRFCTAHISQMSKLSLHWQQSEAH